MSLWSRRTLSDERCGHGHRTKGVGYRASLNVGRPNVETFVYKTVDDADEPLSLHLDFYPATSNDEPAPLIVYLFGGAWMAGDREQVKSWMSFTNIVGHGYALASIDHRLSSIATFPAQIEDVWDAIAWLIDQSSTLSIDPARIGVVGPSAGGHLAALTGATSRQTHFGARHIGAVVDFYGPSDFLAMDANSISDDIVHDGADSPESRLIGRPIQEAPDEVARANPITYLTNDAPPFLVVHGEQDRLVPHHQSELLVQALNDRGVEHEFVSLPLAGHGGFEDDEWFEYTRRFFDRHLKRPKA